MVTVVTLSSFVDDVENNRILGCSNIYTTPSNNYSVMPNGECSYVRFSESYVFWIKVDGNVQRQIVNCETGAVIVDWYNE